MNELQDGALIEQIAACYQRLSGKSLPGPKAVDDRCRWLDEEAPYSLLAHGSGADPHFIYANQCALACFAYTRAQMLQLPSRLSAASPAQQERQRMLDSLQTRGIVDGYTGLRINSRGESFSIYNGVIWQLQHPDGTLWGQAALFWLTAEDGEHRFA